MANGDLSNGRNKKLDGCASQYVTSTLHRFTIYMETFIERFIPVTAVGVTAWDDFLQYISRALNADCIPKNCISLHPNRRTAEGALAIHIGTGVDFHDLICFHIAESFVPIRRVCVCVGVFFYGLKMTLFQEIASQGN